MGATTCTRMYKIITTLHFYNVHLKEKLFLHASPLPLPLLVLLLLNQ